MTDTTSVLAAARNAHAERIRVWQDDAESRVEDMSSLVTEELARILRLDVRHESLQDMIWAAGKDQTAEGILAVPMVNVFLESVLEGVPVRVTLNEGIDPRTPLDMAFAVASGVTADGTDGPWVGFKSLWELGSHLV